MHLTFRNVNDAFHGLVEMFHKRRDYTRGEGLPYRDVPIVSRPSRNGDVLMIDEPVIITYTHPKERVLFNAARDANPFFHLYEAMWMLAGRNDVAPLKYYVSDFDKFSDDGKTLNGAYGYRWRSAWAFPYGYDEGDPRHRCDQLDILVNHLKADPTSRRAVLSMWNVEDDLLNIGKIGNRERCKACHSTGFTHIQYEEDDKPDTCPTCKGACWVDEPGSKDVCCLAGETKFRSPEGDTDIVTLAARFHTDPGYRFPVYTIDPVTGDQRLGWMTAAWRTGVKKLKVITFDDGSVVRLTANHVVYRKRKVFDGKRCIGVSVCECEAGDLRVGDSLLAEMSIDASARTDVGGYRMFKRNVFRNTTWANMVREHREYYEFVTGEQVGDDDIHHKNENKTDNSFDNLERLNPADHQRRHKIGRNNPHRQMSKKDRARRGKIHSAVMQVGGKAATPPHIREILNCRPPYRTDEQNEILWDWVCSISNHKIVSIEDGGYETVYDFTVPGRHNAVLSNGVLVHNCNLSVMFSLREIVNGADDEYDRNRGARPPYYVLDITVTNRSNDLIWGLLGANYVHFIFLQEYMAARLGAEVGVYHHFTNNLHVYDWNWKPEEWLNDRQLDWYGRGIVRENGPITNIFPLVRDAAVFEQELPRFVEANYSVSSEIARTEWTEPFLKTVAQPMLSAFHFHKARDYDAALAECGEIKADDWRIAATAWIARRRDQWEKSKTPEPDFTGGK